MIIYRPHRGSLIDAIEEKKEFESFSDMIDYIYEEWDGWIKKEDIIISHEDVHDDKRIGWRNVHYVCIKGIKNNDGSYDDFMTSHRVPQCIGMCSEDYN